MTDNEDKVKDFLDTEPNDWDSHEAMSNEFKR